MNITNNLSIFFLNQHYTREKIWSVYMPLYEQAYNQVSKQIWQNVCLLESQINNPIDNISNIIKITLKNKYSLQPQERQE